MKCLLCDSELVEMAGYWKKVYVCTNCPPPPRTKMNEQYPAVTINLYTFLVDEDGNVVMFFNDIGLSLITTNEFWGIFGKDGTEEIVYFSGMFHEKLNVFQYTAQQLKDKIKMLILLS